ATVLDAEVERGIEIEGESEGQIGVAGAAKAPKKRGGGARTAEGRARCARNALKEGYRAKVYLHEDEIEAVAVHIEAMTAEYQPATDQQRWWVAKMAAAAARLDRCDDQIPFDLGRSRWRAFEHWDSDRSVYVEQLARKIGREPQQVVRALVKTR